MKQKPEKPQNFETEEASNIEYHNRKHSTKLYAETKKSTGK